MAARKKRVLTPEDQVEAALVPEREWPYEVPENWCWTRIMHIAQMQSGKNIKAKEISEIRDREHPYECFGGNGIRGYVAIYSNSGRFPIVGRQGALCGNVNMADGDFYATEHAVVTTCAKGVDADWLFHALTEMNLNQYATATAQPGLAVGKIITLPISLPPTVEQRRIVNRIKLLFAKLDDAEAELREVIDSSEQRQAAILHKAFNGELALRGDDDDQIWPRVTVGTIASGLKYGTSEKSTYENDGMPVLRIPNVSSSHVDLDDMKYLSHNDVKPADTLQEGDILMIRSNGSRDLVGRCAVVPALDEAYAYASFLIRIRPSDKVDSYYLWYFLQSPDAKAQLFTKAKSSSGIHNINSKEIGATIMPLPSLNRQREIVRVLDAFFDSEKKARTGVAYALDMIRMTRESILSRALRGELGTNDQNEPSSKELLASIMSGDAGK